MGSVVFAALLAIGTTTWIYTKFMRHTGSNTRSSIIASGAAGLFIFFIAWGVSSMLGL